MNSNKVWSIIVVFGVSFMLTGWLIDSIYKKFYQLGKSGIDFFSTNMVLIFAFSLLILLIGASAFLAKDKKDFNWALIVTSIILVACFILQNFGEYPTSWEIINSFWIPIILSSIALSNLYFKVFLPYWNTSDEKISLSIGALGILLTLMQVL